MHSNIHVLVFVYPIHPVVVIYKLYKKLLVTSQLKCMVLSILIIYYSMFRPACPSCILFYGCMNWTVFKIKYVEQKRHFFTVFISQASSIIMTQRCFRCSCVVGEISAKESFVKDHFFQTLAAKGHVNLGQSHTTLHVHTPFIGQLKLACWRLH